MPGLPSYRRVLATLITVTAIAMIFAGTAYVAVEAQRQSIADDAATYKGLDITFAMLSNAVHDQEVEVDDIVISRSTQLAPAYRTAVAAEIAAQGSMQALAEGMTDTVASLSDLTAGTTVWRKNYAEPVIATVGAGQDPAAFVLANSDSHESLDRLVNAIASNLALANAALDGRSAAIVATRSVMIVLAAAVAFAATLLCMWLIVRYGRALERDARRSDVVNRFTEVTSFASDDAQVAAGTIDALALLVHPESAVIHVLNRSKDRAVPEATMGTPIAEVLALHELERCAGVVRGSMFVNSDIARPLTVRCPIYPATEGTLACIPLTSGEWVGAIHLYWKQPRMLPLELHSSVSRIVEHAGLAIANRRLMAALQGQASTDPRTGLANSRTFDEAVEEALVALRPNESLAVLMLDIDHFKDFNDRFGHPAGDDALRVFAQVLESYMRDDDLAARYGGEEFTVLLPNIDATRALAVAERIRQRTESTILTLGPGTTARLGVSVGVATAPASSTTRIGVLRAADEALYAAKSAGRNRVALAAQEFITTSVQVNTVPVGGTALTVSTDAA